MSTFVKARGFWLWVLNNLGCDGLTMPWGKVYIRPTCWADGGLRAHEWVHLAQLDRMGPVAFSVTYLWQLCWYGYWDMPMEVEARNAQFEWHEQNRGGARWGGTTTRRRD